MFTFKLLLAKVHFPFNEGHACKLCHICLWWMCRVEESPVLGFASGSSPCVMCMCVTCVRKWGVMSSVGICTPPSWISSGKIGIPHTAVIFLARTALSSRRVEGGVYGSHIHLSFVCLMWHLY